MQSSTSRTLTVAFLLLVTTIFSACDLIGETADDVAETPTGIYIANQGNFGDANGTLTFYDPSTGSVQHDIIPNIGSIIQSIAVRDNRGYIMANSANRIDVFDLDQQARTAQIPEVAGPRYMAFTDNTTAYVTNHSPDGVTVIDTEENTKAKTLTVGSKPEGITVATGRAFVANHGYGSDSTVSVIDLETRTVQNTIDVNCDGPRGIITDNQDEVWVFCTGNTIYDENWNVVGHTDGAVRVLDPTSGTVTAEFPLDGQISTIGPGQSVFFSSARETAFLVVDQEQILEFDTESNTGPSNVAVADGDPIGAIAYSTGENLLYVGRTPGFETSGTIELYAPGDSSLVDEFTAGVAPAFIAIDEVEN